MHTPDHVGHAAFLTDEDGNVVTWNNGCESLFGLAAGQIVGRPVCGLLAGAAGGDCAERWRELAQPAPGGAHPVELRGAGGSTFAATLGVTPQYDGTGALRGSVAAISVEFETDTPEAARVGRTPLSVLVDLFPGTIYAVNRQHRFVLWNHKLETMTELTADELAAVNVLDIFDATEKPKILEALRKVFDEGAQVQLEVEYVTRSGRAIPFLLCAVRIADGGGGYLLGIAVDLSERRLREEKLRVRDRALHAASNGIVITRCDGKDNPIEYVNPAFERITGYSAAEVLGRDSRFMAAPGMDASERLQVREAIAHRRPVRVVFRNLRKDGEVFWNDLSVTPVADERGVVTHFIGVLVDVTATRQRTADLEHEVNHDALTGLANRNLLWDRLEHALHVAQRQKSLVATVLIDLNNFKSINDSLGHEAGDVVLKVVAKRLQAAVRDSDTVARLAGDEFVLVLANQPSLRYALRMIERLRHSLTMPVSFNRNEIPVGAAIGVAVFPHDGASVAELVRAADVAMYHAKAIGGNEIHFFSADMKASTDAKELLESGLRAAIGRNELFLLYQPRVDMQHKVTGFEALLRWRHPEHGVLLPAAFLPEAEDSGCIVPIGEWVLDQACAFLVQLRELGFPGLAVSVNVSQREYSHHGFVAGIAERLSRHGLPVTSLQLELREDGLISNPGLGRDLAAQMRALGLPLSVDEFGVGISDLGFLQELSAGQVKLAKSAVHAIAEGAPGGAIAKTLIDIGHNLSMGVVGEAVETDAQMEFLKAHGCDQVQGSWFSEPLAEDAARRLLVEHAS